MPPQVVEAKQGAGSATLSMAYAAARFSESCLRAQAGEDVTEFAYVQVRPPGARSCGSPHGSLLPSPSKGKRWGWGVQGPCVRAQAGAQLSARVGKRVAWLRLLL